MHKRIFTYVLLMLCSITSVFSISPEAAADMTELEQLIREHSDLLERYPKSEFAATLLFQLAELHYDYAQAQYDQQMQQYEQALAAFDEGRLAEEPQPPKPDMQQTINCCSRFLQDYTDSNFRDKVLYKKAIAEYEGKFADASYQTFLQLVSEFPESEFVSEARFRIGEYHFNNRDYPQALPFYQLIVADSANAYFNMSLYKEGWCFYNLEDYDQAVSSFLRLVEGMETSPDSSGLNLRSEAITYIAGSFTESSGPDGAREFFQDKAEKSYTAAILEKMAELYSDRNDYFFEIASYRVLLAFYPFADKAPDYFTAIISSYETDEQIEQANAVRREIVDYFGPEGVWQQHFELAEQKQAGIEFARNHLQYLATFFQAEEKSQNDRFIYDKAIVHYLEYLQKFPSAQNADQMRFNLADCYFQTEQFRPAADVYQQIVTLHPNSDVRAESGYNRFLSYLELIDEPTTTTDTLRLSPFFQADTATVIFHRQAEKDLLTAGHDFLYTFPNSALLDKVLFAFAEALNNLQYPNLAAMAYEHVFNLNSALQIQAALNAGQCYFDDEQFERAVQWFSRVERELPASPDERQKANTRKALAQLKIAENLQTTNNLKEAAEQYLQTARTTKESAISERAYFDAAAAFKQIGDEEQAAKSFTEMTRNLPNSDAVDRALYNAAGLYENLQNWPQAASTYFAVWEKRPQSELAPKALLNAARCYELDNKVYKTIEVYKLFDEQFPKLFTDRVESSVRAAELCQALKDDTAAKQWLRNAVTVYSQAPDIDPYFAAQAQFKLLQYLYIEFAEIELVPPLKTNLERKIALFKQIATASSEIIRLETADWTLAATHYLGMTFEELAGAFLRAPIPDDLDTEQQQLYQQQLQERAEPYHQRAVETFQKNVDQAQANAVINEWSRKSEERLQDMEHL